jgi:hypothetical protein
MKKGLLLSAFFGFILVCATVWADVYPNPPKEPLALGTKSRKKTSVAMTSEEVVVTLGEKKTKTVKKWGKDEEITLYLTRVSAIFHLENQGSATKLEVGFPSYYAEVLNSFAVKVDGKEVTPRLVKTGQNGGSDKPKRKSKRGKAGAKDSKWGKKGVTFYLYWLVWDMKFAKSEKHTVEVSYYTEAEKRPIRPITHPGGMIGASDVTDRDSSAALKLVHTGYILKTGAPWKGPIGKAVVEVKLTNGLTSKNLRSVTPGKPVISDKSVRWEYEKLEPTQDIKISFNPELTVEEEIAIFEKAVRSPKRWVEKARFGCRFELAKLYDLAGNTEKATYYWEKIVKTLSSCPFEPRQWEGVFEANMLWQFSPKLIDNYMALGKVSEAKSLARELKPKLKKWLDAAKKGKKGQGLSDPERFGNYATELWKKVSEILKKRKVPPRGQGVIDR